MKETLQSFWSQLSKSSAATRMVVGMGVLLAFSAAGISAYRSANPHMEFLVGNMDNAKFARATKALGNSGIRFTTSTGGAPYSIFVDSSKSYEANIALGTSGALDDGTVGISTGASSSAWESSVERLQKADARYWQEVEKQLATLYWVSSAHVISHNSKARILGRSPKPTVSVTLDTGGYNPTPEQSHNVGSMVRMAFNVPEENVSIVDVHGSSIFDGKNNDQLSESLAFQRAFNQDQTQSVQSDLDSIYGSGLTKVRVSGEWSFTKKETIGEVMKKGEKISERTQKSKTPTPSHVGGPAGLNESLSAAATRPLSGGAAPATKDDSETKYAVGSETIHQVDEAPVLTHLSVFLTLDESLKGQEEDLTKLVKGAVGFRPDRGDFMATNTTPFVGVERDEEGAPIAAAPIETPEPPSAMLDLLIERGVELLAVLLFVGLLLRSMKQAKSAASTSGSSGGGGGSSSGGMTLSDLEDGEIEIDPSLLARKHIENLLDSDPDRVSSLLSRWAMGDEFYAESK